MMELRCNCSSFREFEHHSFLTDDLTTSGRVLIVETLETSSTLQKELI